MQPRPRPFSTRLRSGPAALVAALLALGGCGDPAAGATDAPPRSTRRESTPGPGLPEALPSPFHVELRERSDTTSMLLRVTSDSVRYTIGQDAHDLTVLQSIQPETVQALYATLREHQLDKIDTRPNPGADVDGTSIRMLAGRRPASASRMGHFEPEPQYAQDYEACVQALRDLVPDISERGVTLEIEFDPSMAERRASVELDLGTDLLGVTRAPLTVRVAQPRRVTLKVRVGPPAKQLEQTIDLAEHGHALIRVDPELNEPVIVLKPRAPEKPPTP